MAGKCGYEWLAPLRLPDGGMKSVPQTCAKDENHKDDHMSNSKVTAPNMGEARGHQS